MDVLLNRKKDEITALKTALTWALIPESPFTLYFFLFGMTASPRAPPHRLPPGRGPPPPHLYLPIPILPALVPAAGWEGGREGGEEGGRERGTGTARIFRLFYFFLFFWQGRTPGLNEASCRTSPTSVLCRITAFYLTSRRFAAVLTVAWLVRA